MKILEARKKEEKAYNEKKRKYDEVMNLNIVDDEKLTRAQLQALIENGILEPPHEEEKM